MPGSPVHLARRFLDVLTATALTPMEKAAVRSWARPPECDLFFAQTIPDQRHGYEAALRVVAAGTSEQRMIAAALLHDIGKRHSAYGAAMRSMASVLLYLGIPSTGRLRSYRDHGPIGADELQEVGSDPLIVAFARSHQGSRPASIDMASWEVLTSADEPPKATVSLRRRITWPTP